MEVRRSTPTLLRLVSAITTCSLVAACGSGASSPSADGAPDSATPPTVTSTEVPSTVADPPLTPNEAVRDTTPPDATTTSTTTTSTTTTSAATTTTTTTTTTSTTTTLPSPAELGPLDLSAQRVGLGLSVEGRPIIAERYGTPGGRRVLLVGVIHGNEDDGVPILDLLRSAQIPGGVELWLVDSMNPDGQAAQDRHNANDVDLNRNFPHEWGPIGEPGDGQYAGTGPASEPETQIMVNFISQLQPDIAIWYHQDANLIIPSTGRDGVIRARYAELTELPLAQCCGTGGIYTGIAATWARRTLESVAFIVELPGDVPPAMVEQHAEAVLTIIDEGL